MDEQPFDFEQFIANQGSAELASMMLLEYPKQLSNDIERLRKYWQQEDAKQVKDVLNDMLVVAHIMAAGQLQTTLDEMVVHQAHINEEFFERLQANLADLVAYAKAI